MHDLFMLGIYLVLMFIFGYLAGQSVSASERADKVIKIVLFILSGTFILIMATSCMYVKCDNCTFYEPKANEIEAVDGLHTD